MSAPSRARSASSASSSIVGLHLGQRTRLDEHGLDRRDVRRRQLGPARRAPAPRPARPWPGRWRWPSSVSACPRAGRRPTGLPVSVGLPEGAEDVVAELEGVAQRQPVGGQRWAAARRPARARPARRRGAAAARPCTCRSCSGRCARAVTRLRSPRAVPRMSRYWPTLSSMRSSVQISQAWSGAPWSSWSAYTKARSPTRMATPSPKRRASPVQASCSVPVGEAQVGGAGAAPGGRAVHDVVVEQRERVQQLEGRAGVDGSVSSGSPPAPDEAPVAEGRPQPLSPGGQQPAQRGQRSGQVRVQRRPAGLLGLDEVAAAGPRPGRRPPAATAARRARRQARRPSGGGLRPEPCLLRPPAGRRRGTRRRERPGERSRRTTLELGPITSSLGSPPVGVIGLPGRDQAPGT